MVKRILAVLQGKLEEARLQNKVKRVMSALDAAKLNAETELLGVEDSLSEAIKRLAEGDEVSSVLTKLKELFEKKAEIKEGLQTIKEIEDYLNADVKVEKE
jgi:hypothetical protein